MAGISIRVQSMGFAAIIMSLSILLSRFMGLLRDKVISWQFGASGEADLYFAAFIVPDFINYLLAGGYVSITLMPLLSKRFLDDAEDAWRFFSAVFWWALFAVGTLTLLAMIFAKPLAALVAPGFDAAQSARLTFFLRIILPAQIFFVSGACFSALLFLRKQFYIPALTPLIYNGFIIVCGLAVPYLGLGEGMVGFCIGVTLGAGIGAFALPYWATLRRSTELSHNNSQENKTSPQNVLGEGGYGLQLLTPKWSNLRHPLMRSFLYMALPLMLGQSVVMLNEQFMRIFGSMLDAGSVSLLSYARRISQVPVGMVAQALAVASYPFLASLAAKKDFVTFNNTLRTAMHTSFSLLLPLSAWMIAAAIPCMGFVFEGGNFSSADTMQSAPLLQIMLFAVPLWGIQMVLGRAFYALGDTFTPAMLGTVVTIISLPIFYFSLSYGTQGIAIVSLAGVIVYILCIMYIWRKRHGKDAFMGFGRDLSFMTIFSCLSGLLAWQCSELILQHTVFLPSIWPYVFALAGSALVFALTYIIFLYFFCPQLLQPLSNFYQKIRRART